MEEMITHSIPNLIGTILCLVFVLVIFLSKRMQQDMEDLVDESLERWLSFASLPELTDGIGDVQFLPRQESLFINCKPYYRRLPRTWLGQYRHTLEWFVCRIRSRDIDGTFTIVWEDGTLQIGTKLSELKLPTKYLSQEVEEQLEQIQRTQTPKERPKFVEDTSNSETTVKANNNNERQNCEPATHNGMTVWEAAKKGDIDTVLTIIDRGDSSPNEVENLGSNHDATEQLGRSPLYWACFIGHVELVRELLARGGIDADGSAYLAVTSREKADDDRDLMFDPDTGTFSDWVDYPTKQTKDDGNKKSTKTPIFVKESSSNISDTTLIRAMLATAKVSKKSADIDTMRNRLPRRLYQSVEKTEMEPLSECAVCLQKAALAIAVPCGHMSSCARCLRASRRKNYGCPICRGQVTTVVIP